MSFWSMEDMNQNFLVYGGHELEAHDFSNASFQSYIEDIKSQPGYVFNLNGGVVN